MRGPLRTADVEDTWRRGREGLGAAAASTMKDFAARNAGPVQAPAGLQAGVPVRLLSLAWIRHLAVGGGGTFWKRVHERLGRYGGFLELSAVGFDEGRTQAVVRVGRAFGRLAGSGTEYLLEKKDGVWHVVDKDLLWVS